MALIYINNVCADVRLGLWRMDEEPGELLDRYPHLRRLEMPFKNPGRQKEFLCVRALLLEMTGDETLCIDHEESGRPVISRGLQIPDSKRLIPDSKRLIPDNKGLQLPDSKRLIPDNKGLQLPDSKKLIPDNKGLHIPDSKGLQLPDDKWQVSISHTRGYAVLMLSRAKTVGVDIEYRSDRIVKIASHFIRPDEMVSTVEQMIILWCAKETLYKLHSEDNLHYFDMRYITHAQPLPAEEDMADGAEITLENMKRGELTTIHVTLTPEYCLTWAVQL